MSFELDLPEVFEASYEDGVLTVSDGNESVEKKMDHALVDVEIDENIFSMPRAKRMIY